jgi:parallel beta-helix repeat protein
MQLNLVFACYQAFKSKDTVMFRFILLSILFAMALGVLSPNVYAVQRAHVSALAGSDANTATGCTATAPCRLFQAAMSVVDPKGEVVALDSGGYGAVTITKSISLIAPTGVYAGISVFPGSNGVTIATPGISVVLRGITINGQGGSYGVYMSAGKQLTIENSAISNMSTGGIAVMNAAAVRISDSAIRDNAGDGIYLTGSAGAIITRLNISGNAAAGVNALGASATVTSVKISDSVINGSVFGVIVQSPERLANAIGRLYGNRITRNSAFGVIARTSTIQAGALIESAGNNFVRDNAVDVSVAFGMIAMR